jgi:hypothetical protein
MLLIAPLPSPLRMRTGLSSGVESEKTIGRGEIRGDDDSLRVEHFPTCERDLIGVDGGNASVQANALGGELRGELARDGFHSLRRKCCMSFGEHVKGEFKFAA